MQEMTTSSDIHSAQLPCHFGWSERTILVMAVAVAVALDRQLPVADSGDYRG